LNFQQIAILGPWGPHVANMKLQTNWCKSVLNWPRYQLVYFQDGGRRHLGCYRKLEVEFCTTVTLKWPLSISRRNLMHIYSLVTEIWPKTKCKMEDAVILNFQRMLFWAPTDTCMAYVKLHTKCGANLSVIDRDIPVCVFSR